MEAAYDLPSSTDVEDFVGNPLNAFHLIRRFATVWKDIWVTVSNFKHYEGRLPLTQASTWCCKNHLSITRECVSF